MKNKIYYILLCLLASFSFMNNVFAEGDLTFSVNAKADNSQIVKGEKATISVSLKSDEIIKNCKFQISSDENIVLDNKLQTNNWKIVDDTLDNFLVENVSASISAPNNGETVFQLAYVVNGSGNVTIEAKECANENKSGSYEPVTVELTAIEPSDDTTLKEVKVTGGKIQGEFAATKYINVINLESPNFSLELTASNPDYQDDIVVTKEDGTVIDSNNITFSRDGGQSMMSIYVTVNGNNEQKYTFYVDYKQPELDNSLASLKINDKSITLNPGQFDYRITVSGDITSVKIEATLKDSVNFQFDENFTGGITDFHTPDTVNKFAIIIKSKSAQLGVEDATYMIEIVKEGAPSSSGNNSKPSGSDKPSSSSKENASNNPVTGDISMFIMAFILITSLVGSVILYQRNLNGYNE